MRWMELALGLVSYTQDGRSEKVGFTLDMLAAGEPQIRSCGQRPGRRHAHTGMAAHIEFSR